MQALAWLHREAHHCANNVNTLVILVYITVSMCAFCLYIVYGLNTKAVYSLLQTNNWRVQFPKSSHKTNYNKY